MPNLNDYLDHTLFKFLYSFLLLFLLSSVFLATAQEYSRDFVHNYKQEELNASISNWSVYQDRTGLIYVANYDGLLIHDSKKWILSTIQNQLIGLSVSADSSNRIFVGSQGSFGYLKPDNQGQIRYHSLNHLLPNNVQIGAVWKIINTRLGTYFYSPDLIVRWNNGEIIYWKHKDKFRFAFEANNTFYTTLPEIGLAEIGKDGLKILPGTKELLDHRPSYLYSKGTDELNIATLRSGFYRYSNSMVNSIHPKNSLQQYRMQTGSNLPSSLLPNDHVIGTASNGALILDQNLQLTKHYNQDNGLAGNTVRDLFVDNHDNLWIALQEGISQIELSSPWKFWASQENFPSVPVAIEFFHQHPFIGTTTGLLTIEDDLMKQIPNLQGKVWDLLSSNDELFIASQEGLFTYQGLAVKEITSLPEVTKLYLPVIENVQYLIAGHSKGISLFEKTGDKWKEIKNLELSVSRHNSIILDQNNTLWLSAKFDGVYAITNFFTSKKPDVVKYDTLNGLPDVNEIKIIEQDGRLLFTTSRGFYNFNEKNQRFNPDNSILSERIDISNIREDSHGNYIVSIKSIKKKNHIELFRKTNNTYQKEYIQFRRLPEMEVTAIYPDEDDNIWLAGSKGVFRLDQSVKKDYNRPFNTLIRNVSVRDSLIFAGAYFDINDTTGVPPILLDQPEHFMPDLQFEDNNIIFEYSATFYEAPERTMFSHYLQNNEEGWSAWTPDTKKEYNNLPAGTYIFHVRSRNIYDTQGRIASYQFTILPPWYQTTWAYVIFIVLGIVFIWIIVLAYTFRVRMQRRKLKLMVADRTHEVMTQSKKIEQQKDKLQNQYEKIIFQHDDIQQKNSELLKAQLQTQIANNALKKLNIDLEREVEKRTEKIKTTLGQLQLKNKELDTFIYRASHDLKGPISRISGLTHLTKANLPKEVDQQYINLIELTANQMTALVSKLAQVHDLNITKIEEDPINLFDLVNDIKNNLKPLENDTEVYYEMNIDPDLTIMGDAHVFTTILHNLLENALVFRKPRAVDHFISIDITEERKRLQLRVRDTGIGISKDQTDRLFDMFYKGANQSIGSGLGLYLVKLAVDKQNGTIEINSKINEYTEFIVEIPVSINAELSFKD